MDIQTSMGSSKWEPSHEDIRININKGQTPNSPKPNSQSQTTDLVNSCVNEPCNCNLPICLHACNIHTESESNETEESSRLSDLSLSSDEEDYLFKSIEQMKIHFLLSSSISSLSSDDQDSVSRLELTENLSDQSVLSSDDTEFYNDWDSGLNSYVNENLQGNASTEMYDSDSELERIPEQDLPFPHRAQHRMECEICLDLTILRRRVCCDYQICNKCLATYITLKVKDGNVQMECPNDRCNALVLKDEIHYRLSTSMREKFTKYLIDANADPYLKTCPSCSVPYAIDPALLTVNKKKLKYGLKVVCDQCKLVWCYPCHAPFHSPTSCKKYKKDDQMVKRWAKQKKDGQMNAQKCPKCKIFIQKKDGCDHMQCSHCNTDFCYRCGDRYISIRFLGNHWSRFSLFGCKYRLLPQKPALRRVIRGTNFGARLVAAVALAGLGAAAGAVLLGASVFILPGYGILQLRRNIWASKKRKKFMKRKMAMLAAAQREKEFCPNLLFLDAQGYMRTIPEESEPETSNLTSDPQQVQVLVHRSVSFNKDETDERNKDCDVLVNKYINDGSEVFVSRAVNENDTVENIKEDDVIIVTDVQEIKNDNGYSTVVCNIISKVNPVNSENEGKAEIMKNPNVNKDVKEIDSPEMCNVDKADIGAQNKISVNKVQSSSSPHLSNESNKEHIPPIDVTHEKIKKNSSSHADFDEVTLLSLCNVERKSHRDLEEKLKEKEDRLKEKEERLNEKENKLREKEEKFKEKEITNIISKVKGSHDKIPVSEIFVDKAANNGCFGNIFSSSKRAGSPSPGNQEISKSSKPKDPLTSKAATWEKCRRSNMEMEVVPMPKTSLDLPTDIKHYLQKPPTSLSSIINFNYGIEEDGKTKVSEPSMPVIKMESPSGSISKIGSEGHPQHVEYDASIESGYVSKFNFVTYL